eukprot:Skav228715  [mRNA]  locus=scaffold928:85108:85999:- [translate_table: standard]
MAGALFTLLPRKDTFRRTLKNADEKTALDVADEDGSFKASLLELVVQRQKEKDEEAAKDAVVSPVALSQERRTAHVEC